MSDFTTTARPYANAVYDVASQGSNLESWSDALALMAAVVENTDMGKQLDNPQLGGEKKSQLLLKVIGDKLDDQQANLVRLMAENVRLKLLPEVAAQFEITRAQAEGKVDAFVASAFELSGEQESAIIETLSKKLGRDVTLTTTIDESLIGGVVIKAGDTIIDGSMKSQLEALATTLGR